MQPIPVTLITTGGTIGSSITEKSVNVSLGEQRLRDHILTACGKGNWKLTIQSAFNKNSEDIVPTDWLTLIQSIEQAVAAGSQHIIVTHGTDTMAYTATAVALCCRHLAAKIILTGSCYSLEHPKSDVSINLLGALSAVTESRIPYGVYVSFANLQGEVQVIDAFDVKPMAFDEQGFVGCFNQKTGVFRTPGGEFEAGHTARQTRHPAISLASADINKTRLKESSSRVFQLPCYPGMNAAQMCAGLMAESLVIICLYHSGTGPSLPATNSLIETLRKRPDLTFLLTPLPASLVTLPYASTQTLLQAGARLYKDIQPHQLYTLLVLGLASGYCKEELLANLIPHEQPA